VKTQEEWEIAQESYRVVNLDKSGNPRYLQP